MRATEQGKAIRLDCCVSMFTDVQERVGLKLTAMFAQEQAAMMGQKIKYIVITNYII